MPALTRPLAVLLAAGALLLAAHPAQAQSFNIDFNHTTAGPALGGGVPSPSFGGAASQPGIWNSYAATSSPVALANLSGAFTGATINTSSSFSVLAFNNSSNTGDFALLFNDGSQVGTTTQGGTRTHTITGLEPGPYSVLTYTARPQGTEGEIHVNVLGSNEGPIIASGTPTGNTFEQGITHVIHTLNVLDGNISIVLTDFPGAPAAYSNGFQITLIPEPAGLAALLLPCLLLGRRRRSARC